MIDRFGEVPAETQNLIRVSHLRAIASDLELESLAVDGEKLILGYPKKSGMPPITLYLQKKNNLEEALELLEVMRDSTKRKNKLQ